MTDYEKEIIKNIALGKISQADGLKELRLTESKIKDFTLASLNIGYETHDSDAIAWTLYFGSGTMSSEEFVHIFCKLIVEDWHVSHENIALLLQEIKSPNSIECIRDAIFVADKFDYYDNGAAFIRKCCFALGDINTERSWSILNELTKSKNQLIKKAALEQMKINR
jgi:hypothetical protein